MWHFHTFDVGNQTYSMLCKWSSPSFFAGNTRYTCGYGIWSPADVVRDCYLLLECAMRFCSESTGTHLLDHLYRHPLSRKGCDSEVLHGLFLVEVTQYLTFFGKCHGISARISAMQMLDLPCTVFQLENHLEHHLLFGGNLIS